MSLFSSRSSAWTSSLFRASSERWTFFSFCSIFLANPVHSRADSSSIDSLLRSLTFGILEFCFRSFEFAFLFGDLRFLRIDLFGDERWKWTIARSMFYLRFERFHAFLEGLGDWTLMVTEQCHMTISSIVGENLLEDRGLGLRQWIQLILQCLRSIVRSKDLRRETLHQFTQILIQSSSLREEISRQLINSFSSMDSLRDDRRDRQRPLCSPWTVWHSYIHVLRHWLCWSI